MAFLAFIVFLTFMAFLPSLHFKSYLKHHLLSYQAPLALFQTLYLAFVAFVVFFGLLRSQLQCFIILKPSFTQGRTIELLYPRQ